MSTAAPVSSPWRKRASASLASASGIGTTVVLTPACRRERQELARIRAGEIGDRAQHPLLPQNARKGSSGCRSYGCRRTPRRRLCATAFSAAGTSAPTGAKMIAASSGSGGVSSEPPAHAAPSSRAKSCAAVSPGRVKAIDLAPLIPRHLRHDMRRGAEAVDAEARARRRPSSASGSRSARRTAAVPLRRRCSRPADGSSSARRRPCSAA